MKKTSLILLLLVSTISLFSQKYITKNGLITFFSETPVETIEAHNRQVNCALDIETGDFVFKVLMKSFEFEKALMQEHFNENYVESDKFPNASFKGKISNYDQVDFLSGSLADVIVEGELTIHGVTKKAGTKGTFQFINEKLEGKASFMIMPGDYDIKIPSTVINNIAEEVDVTVYVKLDQLKKK